MADKTLLVGSTILIGYFRKTDRNNSRRVGHFKGDDTDNISSITELGIINGATPAHLLFLNHMLSRFMILDFGSKTRDANLAAT